MDKHWYWTLLRDIPPGSLVRTIVLEGTEPQLGIYLGKPAGGDDTWGGLNFNHIIRFGDKDSSHSPAYEVEVYL
jgi:hypothetical protein